MHQTATVYGCLSYTFLCNLLSNVCNCRGCSDWRHRQHPVSKWPSINVRWIELPFPLLQDSSAAVHDEESCVHRALMKYLDAWSLSPDNWEYNLHVGRLLLLQGGSKEALQHLQSGLALRPLDPTLRSGHSQVLLVAKTEIQYPN